jgi:Rrf2 family protein
MLHMAANSRLTVAVHALAWMALAKRRDGLDELTSEEVAASVNTNPVVIRRSLGDLRRAGLVEVRHGPGGGWRLTRPPESITMLHVYDAVEAEPPFALHHGEPNLQCPVGRGIRPALRIVYGEVEAAMRERMARTTVAGVLEQTLEAR